MMAPHSEETTFRTARRDDAEAIFQLWQSSGASMLAIDDIEQLRRVLVNPAAIVLLAVAGDSIVGTLIGTFDGWRGNLYRLVVQPAYRRQGIARELVGRVEQVFAEWGVRRVTALVEVDRPWATTFWAAVGYPRDDRVVRHVGMLSSDLQ